MRTHKKILSICLSFLLVWSMMPGLLADTAERQPIRILLDTTSAAQHEADQPLLFGLQLDQAYTFDQLLLFSAAYAGPELSLSVQPVELAEQTAVIEEGILIRLNSGSVSSEKEQAYTDEFSSAFANRYGHLEHRRVYHLTAPLNFSAGIYLFSSDSVDVDLNDSEEAALILTGYAASSTAVPLLLDYDQCQELIALSSSSQEGPLHEDEEALYQEGYDDGYEAGYESGYEQGLAGEEADSDIDLAILDEFSEAYSEGYLAGYEEGHALGFESGNEERENAVDIDPEEDEEEYQRGYDDGYEAGYDRGYEDALAEYEADDSFDPDSLVYEVDVYIEGYLEGYAEGYALGYEEGADETDSSADEITAEDEEQYQVGYQDGSTLGFTQGSDDAEAGSSYDDSVDLEALENDHEYYRQGFSDGYIEGYAEGYASEDGQQSSPDTTADEASEESSSSRSTLQPGSYLLSDLSVIANDFDSSRNHSVYFDVRVEGNARLDGIFFLSDAVSPTENVSISIETFRYEDLSFEEDAVIAPGRKEVAVVASAAEDRADLLDENSRWNLMTGGSVNRIELSDGVYRIALHSDAGLDSLFEASRHYALAVYGQGRLHQLDRRNASALLRENELRLKAQIMASDVKLSYDEAEMLVGRVLNGEAGPMNPRLIEEYILTKPISLVIDGTFLQLNEPPLIVDGRTLVPMRAVLEYFGSRVDWEAESQSISVYAAGEAEAAMVLIVGSQRALVRKEGASGLTEMTLDVPAQIINDRTMIPLRFVSEALGYQVQWLTSSRSVVIDSASHSS